LATAAQIKKHIRLVLYQGRLEKEKKNLPICYFSAKNTCILVWRIIFGFSASFRD
jgi:hypothetical protein